MDVAAIAKMAVEVVGAAKTVIDGVGSVLEWADRSCVIEVDNMTPETLEVGPHSHESGAFQQAPTRVEPFNNGVMSSHSTAVGQGAVGRFTFNGRGMDVNGNFGNPFIGDNRFNGRVGGARAGEFLVVTHAGDGNKRAHFRMVLSHPLQDNWRFCGRCHGLFWNGPNQQNHRCAAGGFHIAMGFNFVLPHGVPEGPRLQGGWRFCTKCHGMFWHARDPQNHRCPAGGLHNPEGFIFALPHHLPETRILQAGWRFCQRCYGMFWEGPDRQNHRCPAGDLHAAEGWLFALPHRP